MAYTHQESPSDKPLPSTLPPLPLPSGVSCRYIDTTPHSLVFHILESLPSTPSKSTKLILLVHGFPELAYSWRKILPLLSAQGYHAVAFDQRGFGRTYSTTPLPASSFRPLNLLRDTLLLVSALGYDHASCLVGHDFGGVTAALCALARPDKFHSLVLMSHPSKGISPLPFNTSPSHGAPDPPPPSQADVHNALAALSPPRKHYKWYYCTPPANDEMTHPTGSPLHTFLRGYFHLKSAGWSGNTPHKLSSWTADQLAKMPHYYIMSLDHTMRQDVAEDMSSTTDPSDVASKSSRWLPDHELAVYVEEYTRTTFLGGLNWYRIQTNEEVKGDFQPWAGKRIEVPTKFVAGDKDWGTWQEPGAVEAMEEEKSIGDGMYRGTKLVPGAGHWVNQEQPERCVAEILEVVKEVDGSRRKEVPEEYRDLVLG